MSSRLSVLTVLSTLSSAVGAGAQDDASESKSREEQFEGGMQDTITHELIPVRRGRHPPRVEITASRGCLEIKLLLLSPVPSELPPFEKSVVHISTTTKPVRITVYRACGAESHFLQLTIAAKPSADVTIVLPLTFRGIVNVESHPRKPRVLCNTAFSGRMKCGFITLDRGRTAAVDEDEISVRTPARVELRLMDAGDRDRHTMLDRLKLIVRRSLV
ncbi:hypothetical protein GLOTRDRAFT_127056 [Gloeophyllum trabeum ATCC 11539]|uniref:Uncharacterized protein n=1 Tax=Gloeophyllum trabeum (strain ATCC 11539 / FP-39264 / Madison 617) TaxID=670483 RepID=S7QH48_GLOTA|nr:uncharacterized protein GLOTRDRAFT_127056 [Gloeophyllum trabeum ATCC 11539]EPQ58558.1 hypothetical protein GLOTRDRAFT_127056 [Gloeophyllum trabeum ATCC 11539]